MILQSIETPADIKGLSHEELAELCEEIRAFVVETVITTGGHLGSNLGVVELTLALHRVFDSPRDVILFDTGHQAYVLRGQAAGRGGDRRVVAVVGDGALTGGMAYEALNNLGPSGRRVVVVLNDNGRSYAPTVSHLSHSLTSLRLNPTYVQARERIRTLLRDIPGVGELAYSGVHGLTSAVREFVTPH